MKLQKLCLDVNSCHPCIVLKNVAQLRFLSQNFVHKAYFQFFSIHGMYFFNKQQSSRGICALLLGLRVRQKKYFANFNFRAPNKQNIITTSNLLSYHRRRPNITSLLLMWLLPFSFCILAQEHLQIIAAEDYETAV